MSKLQTIIAATALAVSGLATASPAAPVWHLGVENRPNVIYIPVCAKADLPAGQKGIWTGNPAVRSAIARAAVDGCYERLGRLGDMGYARQGVSLISIGGNEYAAAIDGKPAGKVLRALAEPSPERLRQLTTKS